MRGMARMRTTTGQRRGVAISAAMVVLMVLGLLGAIVPTSHVSAQDPVEGSQLGEPTTLGGMRPGPMGAEPEPFRKRGVQPVAIKIEKADVDTQVEQQEIIDGVMQNPSGPFVVAWYRGTGRLGEDDNVVLAGHYDYWDVGAAIFYNLPNLTEGDEIDVTGEDGQVYKYKVEWVKNYTVDDLNAESVKEIVGSTKSEKLTLITCGGFFDAGRGEYLERMVVRATRME
jgi:LPXTG-site transpeptidase (sortase) family protein